jgi:hypothetical protein
MNYVAVLPYVYGPYFRDCIDTLKLDVLHIDNTKENLGVAESWNRGIDEMRSNDAEWLIIISSSMRFGQSGGLEIASTLKDADSPIVFFSDNKSGPLGNKGFGYHCAALHRDLIDTVGYFDSNFWPIYFEDSDYNLRIWKTGIDTICLLPIDATTMGYNKGIELAGIAAPPKDNIVYFASKWGIHPDAISLLTAYDHPFNNPEYSVKFFPPAHGRTWQ